MAQKRRKSPNEKIIREKFGLQKYPDKIITYWGKPYTDKIFTTKSGRNKRLIEDLWADGFFPIKIEGKHDNKDDINGITESKGIDFEKRWVLFYEGGKCANIGQLKRIEKKMGLDKFNEYIRKGFENLKKYVDPNEFGKNCGSTGIYTENGFTPMKDVEFRWTLRENQNMGKSGITGCRIELECRKICINTN